MSGEGCDAYRAERINMPGEFTASREFVVWFNALDARMLATCRK